VRNIFLLLLACSACQATTSTRLVEYPFTSVPYENREYVVSGSSDAWQWTLQYFVTTTVDPDHVSISGIADNTFYGHEWEVPFTVSLEPDARGYFAAGSVYRWTGPRIHKPNSPPDQRNWISWEFLLFPHDVRRYELTGWAFRARRFAYNSIPEPSSVFLFASGGLLLLLMKHSGRSGQTIPSLPVAPSLRFWPARRGLRQWNLHRDESRLK
jgi:hypothetical protein